MLETSVSLLVISLSTDELSLGFLLQAARLVTNISNAIAIAKHFKILLFFIFIIPYTNNFNIEEINGEHYYRPDGSLLLIREYDSNIIRDYYTKKDGEDGPTISRILEHEKDSGRLKTKIEPITRKGSRLTTNITIFDLKINNKYIIIQLSEGGFVNNISEFTGKGKSFQTLFRNIDTLKPARYIEGKEDIEIGFEMIDCIFDYNGNIARIKKYSNNREVNINYTTDSKNITVKRKK